MYACPLNRDERCPHQSIAYLPTFTPNTATACHYRLWLQRNCLWSPSLASCFSHHRLCPTFLTLNYVQRVLVCSLLVRSDKTGCLTLDQFNSNISKCNHYLKVFAASESEVAYHSHQGFWTVPVGVWSRDGLHPNTAAGRKKYQVSLRRAILSFST